MAAYCQRCPGARRAARRVIPALVVCMCVASTSMAVTIGNAEQGHQLFETCRGCHAVPGKRNAYPQYEVPALGGQQADYIVAALKSYRQGKRDNPTMQAQARSLSLSEIRDIAAYLTRERGS